jgi:ribosome-binding ATPase YchF (GTP1/OBG family)
MKVGIAGFSGCGKSTVFHWLTGVKPDPSAGQRGQLAIAKIPDIRLEWLSSHFHPKKTTLATLEFLDTPGLLAEERRDNARRLSILREAGSLLVVLSGFSEGDLWQELGRFRDELLFADLEIVSNRIAKLQEQLKKPKPGKEKEADQQEMVLLQRIVASLEKGGSDLHLQPEEEKNIRSFQLLTLKPELILVNTNDEKVKQPLPQELLTRASSAVQAPAKLELELEELGAEDREAFMKELQLAGSSRDEILRTIYYSMGEIVFFTVGEDECRAWTLSRGQTAVEGAAQIHTDLAKRFVRAEVVSYEDFRRVGSMKEAKAKGCYRLEGKTYIVQDGDIMHIL